MWRPPPRQRLGCSLRGEVHSVPSDHLGLCSFLLGFLMFRFSLVVLGGEAELLRRFWLEVSFWLFGLVFFDLCVCVHGFLRKNSMG